MNQNERPDTKALNKWLSAPGMGLIFSNEETKNLVRPLVAWIDAQPSAPVNAEDLPENVMIDKHGRMWALGAFVPWGWLSHRAGQGWLDGRDLARSCLYQVRPPDTSDKEAPIRKVWRCKYPNLDSLDQCHSANPHAVGVCGWVDVPPAAAVPVVPEEPVGEWHCEGDAVGVYWEGICSPENPIHSSPCGPIPSAPVADVEPQPGIK